MPRTRILKWLTPRRYPESAAVKINPKQCPTLRASCCRRRQQGGLPTPVEACRSRQTDYSREDSPWDRTCASSFWKACLSPWPTSQIPQSRRYSRAEPLYRLQPRQQSVAPRPPSKALHETPCRAQRGPYGLLEVSDQGHRFSPRGLWVHTIGVARQLSRYRLHPEMADAPFDAVGVTEQSRRGEEEPAPAPHPKARVAAVDAAKNVLDLVAA